MGVIIIPDLTLTRAGVPSPPTTAITEQGTGPAQNVWPPNEATASPATVNPVSWTQAVWYVDPQNVSGNASDNNKGDDPSFPVQSYNGGIVAKWGTTSPMLRQDTTISWLSSQPANFGDPVVLTPITVNSVLVVQGQLTAANRVHAGALAGVVAKNRATGQLLNADLGFAAAPGMLVKNTTGGKTSFAFVYKNVAGTTFALTQPLAPLATPQPEVVVPVPVDTWANADTFEVYRLTDVMLTKVSPTMANPPAPNFPCVVQLYRLHGMTVDGVNSNSSVDIDRDVTVIESSFDSLVQVESGSDDLIGTYANTYLGAGTYDSQGGHQSTYFFGGAVNQVLVGGGASWSFDYDAIIASAAGPYTIGTTQLIIGFQIASTLGRVYIDGTMSAQGVVIAYDGGSPSTHSTVWGPGSIDGVGSARILYKPTTAVATFINAGGLTLNGLTNANPFNPATAVWEPALAITTAHLDAAFGVAGFGGMAINPGGASIIATASA